MKFKDLMKKVFSTKKGKAIFSVIIACAVAGISVGSYNGYKAEQYAKEQAAIEKENEERIANYKSLAKEADDEIEAIGTVTAESEPLVTRAEDYYNDLPKGAKEYVTKYDTLVSARTSLDALLTSKDKADKVIAEIDGIGDVELTKADQIKTARTDYDALSDDEKAMVTNYDVLTSAESTLTALNDKATSKDTEVPSQTALNDKSKKKSTSKKTSSNTNDTVTATTPATTTTTPTTTDTTTASLPADTPSVPSTTPSTDTGTANPTPAPSTPTAPTDTASTTTPSTDTNTQTTTDTAGTTTSSEPSIVCIMKDGGSGRTSTITYSDGRQATLYANGTVVGSDW